MKTIVHKLGKSCRRWLLALSLAWVGVGIANAATSDITDASRLFLINNGTNAAGNIGTQGGGTVAATISDPADAGNTFRYYTGDNNGYAERNGDGLNLNWNSTYANHHVILYAKASTAGKSIGVFLHANQGATTSRNYSVFQELTTDYAYYDLGTVQTFVDKGYKNGSYGLIFPNNDNGYNVYVRDLLMTTNPSLYSNASAFPAPANVAATAQSATSIRVSWDAVQGATGYTLYRSTDGTSWDAGTSATSPATVTGLNSSTQYYFRVIATDGNATSDPSSSASATTLEAVPVLSISGYTNSSISLSWTYAGTDTPVFSVLRSTDGSNYSELATTAAGATTYTDSTVSSGNTYYYKVQVKGLAADSFTMWAMDYIGTNEANPQDNRTGNNAFRQDVYNDTYAHYNAGYIDNNEWAVYQINPARTGTYTATALLAADNKSFTAHLNDSGDKTTPLATFTGSSTAWQSYVEASDTIDLTAGNKNIYFVAASSLNFMKIDFSIPAQSAGTASNAVSQEIAAIAAPTNVSANATAYNSITVSWTASDNAVSYEVFRSGSENGTYTSIGTTNTTSLVDGGRSQNTTYYYKVKATDAIPETSDFSAVASAKTPYKFAAPTGVTATVAGTTSIDVSWTAVGGATSYKVYRNTHADDGNYTLVATQAGTSLTDTGLTSSTTYYYYVVATDGANDSP
ncbi:MAG: fibronectin type III domain-containing protein, partial [Bacteroidales bacterium]|nr:fibronectin type III domain-containing protein [Bacteroidales bacterium]